MNQHVIYDAYEKELERRKAEAEKDKKEKNKDKEKIKVEKKLPYDDLLRIKQNLVTLLKTEEWKNSAYTMKI